MLMARIGATFRKYQKLQKLRFWHLSTSLTATEGATLMRQTFESTDFLRKSGNLRPYDWIIYLLGLLGVVLVHTTLGHLILVLSNTQNRIPCHLEL